jgi:hypothetical protein
MLLIQGEMDIIAQNVDVHCWQKLSPPPLIIKNINGRGI